ncbi:hypothetical protein R0131_04285 [Clostridium sp. AL.422]|uniref:hypothetical protein n=1 Tax=Clostridium TaxID=1485 RepID=UPI00293DD556|nr:MULTISPECIES: hypothetical protein [unclassified Clostridium]MDV4150049.1 hypothetical protein [Clostridium sp. AL.422]
MKKLATLLILIFIIFTLGSCSEEKSSNKPNSSYAYMLIFNNTNYYLTADVLSKEDLGKQIGSVSKQVLPYPKNEGEANECPVGTKIFKIKETDTNEIVDSE